MTIPPWHQLCPLRDDVRSGRLTLDEFAADLNGVRTGEAPEVYRTAALFFERTYPTYRMKQLVRDVLLRLAGQGGKPVQQLQVAYGGGKTHTLITLLHLAERGAGLAGQRTVQEFAAFAGLPLLPQARVALLPFDKFDVKEGMEVYGPGGRLRRVRTPWGALAYQLAGDAGYARLKDHDEAFTVPAEPLLVDLLRAPEQERLGALVLVDEAVWYYRNLVLSDRRFFGALKDFYQVLTQAVAKVPHAALVAALIASKVEAADATGIECLGALEDIFKRIAEPVEPVAREDVSEVLRRRLFESVPGLAERRPVIDAVMASWQQLPLRDAQRDQAAYDRLLQSYPFHPDFIEVLYQKWTQYDQFQRTRGALRLLAQGLRETAGRDPAPLVGVGALLHPEGPRLSGALNELITITGDAGKWGPLLTGELEKAREIQAGLPTLQQRELEQAVVATFLHSHPPGQRAAPTDLVGLLGHPQLDAVALEEGLRKWRERSWFLVESPDIWRLSTHPNLNNIHVRAMEALSEKDVEEELKRRIRGREDLKAAEAGVVVHLLPTGPADVANDLQLHYLILGPECAVEPGKPLPPQVTTYFNEVTGPHNPRIYRNNVVALLPEASRLAGLRDQVRKWLGWDRIESTDEYRRLLTDAQKKDLPHRKAEATNNLPEAVLAAYNLLAAVDEAGVVRLQALRPHGGTAFDRIKATLAEEERILLSTLDPDLLLPGSYLELWGAGETSKRPTALLAAFGQFARLPRLLKAQTLYASLQRSIQEGVLVARLTRGDGSTRTYWRSAPDEETLKRPDVELVPASLAQLTDLSVGLLQPGAIPELWPAAGAAASLAAWRAYFDGQRAPRLAAPQVLDDAVRAAVLEGRLLAQLAATVYFREPLPAGPLPETLSLLPPPAPLQAADLTRQNLPEAWAENHTTAARLQQALAARRAQPVPWLLLQPAIDEALRLKLLEHDPAGEPWPCSPALAEGAVFRVVEEITLTPEMMVAALPYAGSTLPTLQALKEAVEGHVVGRSIPEATFFAAAKLALQRGELQPVDRSGYLTLSSRVQRPARELVADTVCSAAELGGLSGLAEQLLSAAPDLDFTFRVVITATGQSPDEETRQRLNALLDKVHPGWRWE